MKGLCIGPKARRKRTMQRVALWAWLGTLGAAAAGIPIASVGWDLLGEIDRKVADVAGGRRLRGVETSESTAAMLRFRSVDFEPERRPPVPRPAAPAPAPESPASPERDTAPAGGVTDIVYAAAAEFGLDGGYLLSVASCESGLDPNAVSDAGYYGLFQFDETTWAEFGYGSIYDPVAQARTASRLLAQGESDRWPNCA